MVLYISIMIRSELCLSVILIRMMELMKSRRQPNLRMKARFGWLLWPGFICLRYSCCISKSMMFGMCRLWFLGVFISHSFSGLWSSNFQFVEQTFFFFFLWCISRLAAIMIRFQIAWVCLLVFMLFQCLIFYMHFLAACDDRLYFHV